MGGKSRAVEEVAARIATEAHARGDAFRRYGYTDVFDDPRQMLDELRGLPA